MGLKAAVLMDRLEYLIPLTVLVHLILAPHTKVEESFSLQAAHDILVYGTPTKDISTSLRQSYDHLTFQGAVPRSFVGPVLLAGVSQLPVALVGFQHAQLVVRAVLGLFNAACLMQFARGVRNAFGAWAARWFVLLLCGQFHVMFYASRTLPNMFAFGLTTLASSFLLPQNNPSRTPARQRLAIALIALSAIIFRAELVILLATTALHLLVTRRATLLNLARPFVVSCAVALLVSIPLDSYFWQKPLWPELWGFYFNAVKGNSSSWGVSAWHYYFSSALPRILLNPLTSVVLLPLALYNPGTSRAARALLIPSLLFVAIYSLQPHKEARFIFYVSPPLTAAASLGASTISGRASKSITARLMTLALVVSILLSAIASSGMLLLSSLNYPGGDAVQYLTTSILPYEEKPSVAVHADVLTCMTGLTLFSTNPRGVPPEAPLLAGEKGPLVYFDKTEDPATLKKAGFWSAFDYLLLENGAPYPPGNWETLAVVEALSGLEFLSPRDEDKTLAAERAGEDGTLVGKGREIAWVRHWVREVTGGWWVGPRMVPSIRVLKKRAKGARPEGHMVPKGHA